VTALFVSHSSHDKEVTARLVERLQQAGYAALFLDFSPEVGIPAGRHWQRELYAQLAKCDGLVFIGSPSSAASQWCAIELAAARWQGKPKFSLCRLRLDPAIGCWTICNGWRTRPWPRTT
jgi:hypothetical protein